MFIDSNEDTFGVGQSLKRIHGHFKGAPCSFSHGILQDVPLQCRYIIYFTWSAQNKAKKSLLYTFEKISLWFYLNWMIFSLFFRRFSFLNSSLACFGTSFFILVPNRVLFINIYGVWITILNSFILILV